MYVPTAMQRDSAGQETFPRVLLNSEAFEGVGTDCSDQVLPFHLTAFVALMAVQALAALHETSVRLPPAEIVCRDQEVPFQAWAIGNSPLPFA
jgi:hypothetical protein